MIAHLVPWYNVVTDAVGANYTGAHLACKPLTAKILCRKSWVVGRVSRFNRSKTFQEHNR